METMALDPAVGRLAQLANGHKYTGTHGELSAVLAHMTASSNMHVREYQQVCSGRHIFGYQLVAPRHVHTTMECSQLQARIPQS